MVNSKVDIKYSKIFIDNEWHNSVSGKTFATVNPTTGENIVSVQEGDKADVDKAVAAAERAFQLGSQWRRLDASARGRLLNKLAELITRDADYIASLDALDGGKPLPYAHGDVNVGVTILKYYAGYADKLTGKTVPVDGDYFAYTRLEPIGVVAQILPWNAPFLLNCFNFAPAIAAGNVIVSKPAEQTPLSTLYFASLVKEAGFPPGVYNVLPGYGPTAGSALAHHDKVDMIAFTGSRNVGKLVQEASGKSNLKKVALELGGKSPLVISQHCDLDEAVGIAQLACYNNAGQTCCAGTRIFVHEAIYDAFVEKSTQAALKRKLGDPFAPDTTQGPQINQQQLTRILELIESGKQQGATLKCGGKRFGNKGYFVEPTIFADVQDNMRIAREEIFGPVMQIFKYKTIEEAVQRSNDTEYGLAAGILSKNIDEATYFSNSVRAGVVWVNNYYGGMLATPFGGYKQSGIGRTGGEEGILEYTEVKTVTVKISQKNS